MEDKWRYYIASYTSLEDTEGVNKTLLSPVVLARNIHALGVDPKSDTFPPFNLTADIEGQDPTAIAQAAGQEGTLPATIGDRLLKRFLTARNDERLILRIAVNNYHPIFQPGTAEGFYEDPSERVGGEEGVKIAQDAKGWREERMEEGFVMNHKGMHDVSADVVEKANEAFAEVVDGKAGSGEAGEKMEVDE
jgi:paired amphipathic helix protein Sin3a